MGEYLCRATGPEKKKLLQDQWNEACEKGTIHCACGQIRSVLLAYRCLYCGMWLCVNCAEVHFGLTIQQWIEKKRVQRRAELEHTSAIDNPDKKCKHFGDEQATVSVSPV